MMTEQMDFEFDEDSGGEFYLVDEMQSVGEHRRGSDSSGNYRNIIGRDTDTDVSEVFVDAATIQTE